MNTFKSLLIGLFLTGCFYSSAQTGQLTSAKERAEKLTSMMTSKLNLSADQQTKVAELNLGVALKNEAILKSTDKTKEFKVASIKGNNQGRRDYLKLYLTPEQYVLFEQMEKDFIEQRKANTLSEILIENENDIN